MLQLLLIRLAQAQGCVVGRAVLKPKFRRVEKVSAPSLKKWKREILERRYS